jgi:hypothetical protein
MSRTAFPQIPHKSGIPAAAPTENPRGQSGILRHKTGTVAARAASVNSSSIDAPPSRQRREHARGGRRFNQCCDCPDHRPFENQSL